jgi:hypothetical protein
MKFNIYFTVRGPGGTVEVPNKFNPVEAEDLRAALSLLSAKLPEFNFDLEFIGVRVDAEI